MSLCFLCASDHAVLLKLQSRRLPFDKQTMEMKKRAKRKSEKLGTCQQHRTKQTTTRSSRMEMGASRTARKGRERDTYGDQLTRISHGKDPTDDNHHHYSRTAIWEKSMYVLSSEWSSSSSVEVSVASDDIALDSHGGGLSDFFFNYSTSFFCII